MSSSSEPSENATTVAVSPSPTDPNASTSTVPAGWQTVKLRDVAELSIPDDWTVKSHNASQHTVLPPADTITGFPPATAIAASGNLAGGDEKEAFDWMANRDMETNYAGYTNLKRLPDEVINGTTFYRIQCENNGTWFDVYGTVTPDGEYSVSIEWSSMKTINRKQAEAIWSPVMPTFKML